MSTKEMDINGQDDTSTRKRASYGMGLVDGCRYGEREENIDHVGPKIIIHERP